MNEQLIINETLVRCLITDQFPQWKDLPVRPVTHSGWDNRTFHLGEHMLVRMPSAEDYALQVEKEQRWLPKLAPKLPLPIPAPVGLGKPANGYPWTWSIYAWLPGETAIPSRITDLSDFAINLAQFLIALQSIDSKSGPVPGLHSFYRGGSLATYDNETRQAFSEELEQVERKEVERLFDRIRMAAQKGDKGARAWLVENEHYHMGLKKISDIKTLFLLGASTPQEH